MLDRLGVEIDALRRLARLDPGELLRDDDLLAAVKYRFIVAIEVCIDVGRHVVASEGLRAPLDYADAFAVLADAGLLDPAIAAELRDTARFRNLLVTATRKWTTPGWWRSCGTASTISPPSAPLSPGPQAADREEVALPPSGARCSADVTRAIRFGPWTANSRPRRSTPARPTAARSITCSAGPTTTRTGCWARIPTRTARSCARCARMPTGWRCSSTATSSGRTRWSRCTTPGCGRGRAGGARRLPPAGALRRRRPHRGRPVPLAAHARRDRPAPDRRGPPRAAVGRPRRARAHLRHPVGPVTGTSFAVWAPTAQGVRVTGDFDGWAGWTHPMRSLGSSGVWEIFVPGVGVGTRYKFRVLGRDGAVARQGRPDGVRDRDPAVHRVGRHLAAPRVERRRLDGAPRAPATRTPSR